MAYDVDVAIIGAGPYGLSLAAHLRAARVDFRIFGMPMQTWRTRILTDSHLKSDGFATSLSEPSGRSTLKAHCERSGLAYADTGLPVPLATFVDYALTFQRQHVPGLEPRDVTVLRRVNDGYALHLTNGVMVTARRVVVAVGITWFQYLPPILAAMPPELVSHSSVHSSVGRFAGRDVLVVGAGASAADMAVSLLRVGARVSIVARREALRFNHPPRPRTLRDQIRAPMSGLGPGWKSRFCTDAPLMFHAMPARLRTEIVRRHLGPAPCWFTRDDLESNADLLLGREITAARDDAGGVRLSTVTANGATEDVMADHVVAATGYRVDLARIAFIEQKLRASIQLCDSSPVLNRWFESNVPGLYFVGLAAANSFGPISRFVFGAGFTAGRLSAHLASTCQTLPRQLPLPVAA